MSPEIWKCRGCGEEIEAQFDTCWNCETPRPDPADRRSADDQPAPSTHAEESAVDGQVAAMFQEPPQPGEPISADSIQNRATWTISSVVLVGLLLIAANTAGGVIRDAIHLDMLESKQKSQMKEMRDDFKRFGR